MAFGLDEQLDKSGFDRLGVSSNQDGAGDTSMKVVETTTHPRRIAQESPKVQALDMVPLQVMQNSRAEVCLSHPRRSMD